ncbi:MAG: hypothetical protein JO125_09200 [Chloroflexi bacterium]|nr:hypothetical protein [Chloroflexota bacterium]
MSSTQSNDPRANREPDSTQPSEESTPPIAPTRPPTPEAVSSTQVPEANGGPLGCCLGVTIGIVLSLVIGVMSRLYADPLASALGSNLSTTVRVVIVVVAVVAASTFGYFGWKLGQKIYKEYDPPVIKDRRLQTKLKPKRLLSK